VRHYIFNDPDVLFAFEECEGQDPYHSLLSLSALCFTVVDESGMKIMGATKGYIAALKPLSMADVMVQRCQAVSYSSLILAPNSGWDNNPEARLAILLTT
jgi:hypothetical protein